MPHSEDTLLPDETFDTRHEIIRRQQTSPLALCKFAMYAVHTHHFSLALPRV
jgi:hypothetical protein